MNLTTRTAHQVAAVLVVVFLLTTVWLAYSLYAETHDSSPTTTTPVATYAEEDSNGFTAALQPSYLYNNSTEVSGGNVTLFTPITTWINVTMLYTLSTNRTSSMTVHAAFTAVLSTLAWSKTLFASSNTSSSSSTQVLSLAIHYSVNVSELVGLATAIDGQIGYTPPAYTLTLSPEISGTVDVGGTGQPISSDPLLNFSFRQGLIVPSGLTYSSTGMIEGPPITTSPGPFEIPILYAAIAVSGAALAASVVIVTRPREKRTPPLSEVIAPYEEAIAGTDAFPRSEVDIPVGQFADLAKIADTLGKPILRPTAAEPDQPTFFVLDGEISYSFQYPSAPGGSVGGQLAKARSGRDLTDSSDRDAVRVIRRLQNEANRLQGVPVDNATRQEVLRRIQRAIDLVHAHDLREAAREAIEISRLIDRAEPQAGR